MASEPQKSPTFGGANQTAIPTNNNDGFNDDLTAEEKNWIAEAEKEKVPSSGVEWPSE